MRFTVCGALVVFTVWVLKVSDEGEGFTVWTAAMLVPLRLTVWGLLVSLRLLLSVKVRVPVSLGVVEGVNVTPTVQLAPGKIVPVHVFAVVPKSVEVLGGDEIVSETWESFVSVTV